jgi:protein-tyrosine kinase
MSRIHEALKKAALEKALQAVRVDLAPAPDPLACLVHLSGLPEANVEATEAVSQPHALGFEDLVARCAQQESRSRIVPDLSACGDNGQIAAEEFRTLRSRLYQIAGTRPLRRILVTSSLPAEGKTFVSANLAHSIARQPQRRALLIEADLRAARSYAPPATPRPLGLTDYLREHADEYAVIQKRPDTSLYFISSGASVSNPSELLLSDRMKTLLDRVTPLFDWVIVDSPPALLVHDASRLADLCDGVLFIVRAGATSQESAQKTVAEFRNKNLLGVVLNQVESAEMKQTYSYGYSPEK